MKGRIGILVAASLLVQACSYGYEFRDVQKRYTADRKECREYAEEMMGLYGRGSHGGYMPEGDEHLQLVEQFARCMEKRGWMVNRPPKS